ncbi:MAG: U32 family peptidase [Polyangiaceae bacterium]|nr:U32 family peptidase [Polyangiaceae bacterium]
MPASTSPVSPSAVTPRKSELLMPAGSLSCLKTALLYGADAVYAGTPDLSLRTQSEFSVDDLAEGIALTHAAGKRIYLTLNLFTHNRDVETLARFKDLLSDLRPDGIIVADPGVFQFFKDEAPWLERHISTQANVSSFLTVDYWQKQGAALCVLSREVSFEELSEIRERSPNIRLETFIHGALCMTYSGRCLLSNYMAERGSNQGNCAHSCRWKYNLKVARADGTTEVMEITDKNMDDFKFFLEEEFRPGQLFPIEEDERGSYILNSRDLCLMPKLDQYLKLGVDSLKVEGRNKNEYYVGLVARAYRQAIDAYYADPEAWDFRPFMSELEATKSRGYTLGFHEGRLTNLAHDYENGQSLSAFEFAGFVREWEADALVVELRNRWLPGDILEFLPPGDLSAVRLRLYDLIDAASLEKKEKLSAGDGRAARIPMSLFHNEDQSSLRQRLPLGTLVRKRALLNAEQAGFLKANQQAQKAELGLIPASALVASARSKEVRPPPRLGLEGCCGLGCNGCLMFWNEPKFEGARAKLKVARPGTLLAADWAK